MSKFRVGWEEFKDYLKMIYWVPVLFCLFYAAQLWQYIEKLYKRWINYRYPYKIKQPYYLSYHEILELKKKYKIYVNGDEKIVRFRYQEDLVAYTLESEYGS